MIDIVPELLEKIERDFAVLMEQSNTIQAILESIKAGTATYREANVFASEVGSALSLALRRYITLDSLPDGRMYFNIAERILGETLGKSHSLIAGVANEVQTILNKNAGVGIKPVGQTLNKDRVKGLVDKISNEADFEKVSWLLGEPVVNFSQAVVDESIKSNAEFHYNSGLSAKIVRTPESGACKWCKEVAGTYSYPDVPDDVYRRHDRCRCIVNFESKEGKTAIHKGTEGKRKYVKDKYGYYEKTREERLKHAKELEETAKERAAAARQKRIDTWKQKKLRGS